jgi:hypothetical protein
MPEKLEGGLLGLGQRGSEQRWFLSWINHTTILELLYSLMRQVGKLALAQIPIDQISHIFCRMRLSGAVKSSSGSAVIAGKNPLFPGNPPLIPPLPFNFALAR